MKAVVTHIQNGRAVLLTKEGTFVRVTDRGYRVGQQIAMPQKHRHPLRTALAAACLAVLFSVTAYAAETLPFSYVSVDVNPSLQMTLNWFNQVCTIEAVNEDAQPIVDQLQQEGIQNQSIADAMQMVYDALEEGTYLTGTDTNEVVVAVVSYGIKNVDTLARQLEQTQTIESSGTVLNVTTVKTDVKTLAEAQSYQTTAGKLAIVKPLVQDSPGQTQAWLDKPVRDILSASGNRMEPENTAQQNMPQPTDGSTWVPAVQTQLQTPPPAAAPALGDSEGTAQPTPAPCEEATEGTPAVPGATETQPVSTQTPATPAAAQTPAQAVQGTPLPSIVPPGGVQPANQQPIANPAPQGDANPAPGAPGNPPL